MLIILSIILLSSGHVMVYLATLHVYLEIAAGIGQMCRCDDIDYLYEVEDVDVGFVHEQI